MSTSSALRSSFLHIELLAPAVDLLPQLHGVAKGRVRRRHPPRREGERVHLLARLSSPETSLRAIRSLATVTDGDSFSGHSAVTFGIKAGSVLRRNPGNFGVPLPEVRDVHFFCIVLRRLTAALGTELPTSACSDFVRFLRDFHRARVGANKKFSRPEEGEACVTSPRVTATPNRGHDASSRQGEQFRVLPRELPRAPRVGRRPPRVPPANVPHKGTNDRLG